MNPSIAAQYQDQVIANTGDLTSFLVLRNLYLLAACSVKRAADNHLYKSILPLPIPFLNSVSKNCL